jgi:cAMP phosphodiesterase
VNDTLLIDAGSATAVLTLRAQRKITDILVTHTHLDHVMTLGSLADNLYGKCPKSINVWSIGEVIDGLKKFFFNNQIWPDFTSITGPGQDVPVVKLCQLPERRPIPVGTYSVTAVRVNHVVPSVALFIDKGNKTLLHIGDTGPTEFGRSHANGAISARLSSRRLFQTASKRSRTQVAILRHKRRPRKSTSLE